LRGCSDGGSHRPDQTGRIPTDLERHHETLSSNSGLECLRGDYDPPCPSHAISRGECTGRTTIGGPTCGLSVNCQRSFGRRRRCARTFPGRFMPHSDRARSVGKDPLTTERSQERPGQAFITFMMDVATSDPARPRLPANSHTRRPAYAESVPMPCQCRSAATPHG
jgi:hypothetical protein